MSEGEIQGEKERSRRELEREGVKEGFRRKGDSERRRDLGRE